MVLTDFNFNGNRTLYGCNFRVIFDNGLVRSYSIIFISAENREIFIKSIIENGGAIKEELRELVFSKWVFDGMMSDLGNLISNDNPSYEIIR